MCEVHLNMLQQSRLRTYPLKTYFFCWEISISIILSQKKLEEYPSCVTTYSNEAKNELLNLLQVSNKEIIMTLLNVTPL